jgi:DNA-binding PadR family transcriptional regulator
VVYPTLALLVDEGLIAEVAGEGTRKAFSITPAGQDELAQRAEDLAPIIARLTGLAQASARERARRCGARSPIWERP